MFVSLDVGERTLFCLGGDTGILSRMRRYTKI